MARIKRFDHVGVTVVDLEPAAAFFVKLGLRPDGVPAVEVVMLRAPGGDTALELSRVLHPVPHGDGQPRSSAPTEPGLRNVCFEVDDLHEVVDQLAADGYDLVGGIADHEATYRMCEVRGPEGVIVSLA